MQKFYTADFLNKKLKKNNGEVQQYYISENHEPIIPPDIWDVVQEEFKRRSHCKKGGGDISQMVRCGVCGGLYYKKIWHSTDKYRKIIWQCNTKSKCKTPHVYEDEIKQVFIRAVNKMIANKDAVLSAFAEIRDSIYNEAEWVEKQQQAYDKLEEKTEEYHLLCADPLQDNFEEKYEKLKYEVDELQKEYMKIVSDFSDLKYRFNQAGYFFNKLQRQSGLITEFNQVLWRSLVDHVTVYSKDKITVTFRDGTEI